MFMLLNADTYIETRFWTPVGLNGQRMITAVKNKNGSPNTVTRFDS